MKKILYSFIIIYLFLFSPLFVYAGQSTNEIELINKFNQVEKIFKEGNLETFEIFLDSYGMDIFNYSVEILNKVPNSEMSYVTIKNLLQLNFAEKTRRIIDSLKYEEKIDKVNPGKTPVEALINAIFPAYDLELASIDDIKKARIKAFGYLEKIVEADIDKNYSALAAFLMMDNKDYFEKYYEIYKQKYSNSSGIVFTDLCLVENLLRTEKYEECIKTANEFVQKYQNTKLSYKNESLVPNFLIKILFCYIEQKKYDEARKIIERIKEFPEIAEKDIKIFNEYIDAMIKEDKEHKK